MSHPPPPCPESELMLMLMPASLKYHSTSNYWISNAPVWCTTAVMPCSLLQRARPQKQHPPSPHHSHYGSWVTNIDMFIRGTSQPRVLTVPLKPRGWSAEGGQREHSDEQVNFTINSAVLAIKDRARPCITTDITDIKHCIRRGCNGLS